MLILEKKVRLGSPVLQQVVGKKEKEEASITSDSYFIKNKIAES
jgi:hypothetical protein